MIDLSKVEYTSLVDSFKNDGNIYKGLLPMPTSIPAGSNATSITNLILNTPPTFSTLYAYFQELLDVNQQSSGYSGYNGSEWYATSINTKIGMTVLTPSGKPPLDAIIFPLLNGVGVNIIGLVNNPYSSAITLAPIIIPWAFVETTLTY